MKANTYEPENRLECDTGCAMDCANQYGTVQPNLTQQPVNYSITDINECSGRKWHSPVRKVLRTVTKCGTVRVTVQDQNGDCFDANAPSYELNLIPFESLPLSFESEARLYAKFCLDALNRLADCQSKVVEWKRITEDYNSRRILPELFKLRGQRSERTLRIWVETYLNSGCDMFALIHKRKNEVRGRKVTYAEQNYLLNLLLSPKRIKSGSAITLLKRMQALDMIESPSSIKTLVRWCKEWEKTHPAEWHQAREGSKFVSEHIVKSIIRDDSILEVGQVWVADGHTLAFDIINPDTGRAQRMTMILIFDWASRYPVGASLAVTEDSAHISSAFRNAFLHYGGKPQFVYLDNGRAFKSKLFNEQWEEHDLSLELGGIFPRLGIGVAFAESYNARSKVIERFFRTFQEQFERFIESFRGASVADKPATLMRDEKWARKLFERTAPTVEETMQMIAFYIRYIYGNTPHSGIGNKKPYEVFSQAQVPEDRKIEASKLNFLMLTAERKRIRSEGIRLNKMLYWDAALIDHIGQPCVIRYDYSDARWILVYSQQDVFICQAELRRAQHPFIELDKDNPIAHKELEREYWQNKNLRKQTEQRTKKLIKQTQENVDRLIKPMPILITEQSNPLFIQPPAIMAPDPKLNHEKAIEHLDRQVIDNLRAKSNTDDQTKQSQSHVIEHPIQNSTSDESAEDGVTNLARTMTFTEMMKRVGIK